MRYRNGNSTAPLASGAIWSFIAISICACCAAVISSKWYRAEKKRRDGAFNARYGRLPWSSPSGWRTAYPGGVTKQYNLRPEMKPQVERRSKNYQDLN